MFNNFTEEARKVIILAKEEMKELNHPYVSSEHLLLAILKNSNSVSDKLKKYDITYDRFKEEVIKIIGIGKKKSDWTLYTPMLKRIIEKAIMISSNSYDDVRLEHLFEALLDEGEGIAVRILVNMGIDIDTLYNDFVNKDIKKSKRKKTILNDIGKELTLIENSFDPVIGRESELKRVIEILTRRTKNNPLLIGEAGVGKTAIVEELSRLIVDKNVPQKLLNKHIISVDMSSLVAGTKYRGEFEEKINKIIKEVEDNDDIILFIDEIHTLVGAGGAEGAIDAANIFKPALARGKIKVIGATTLTEYKKFMENDKALNRRFQTVMVEEPDIETVNNIVKALRPIYEEYHKVNISDDILCKIIDYASKYIKTRREPDRSIDLLDEVSSHANLKENKDLKLFNILNKELYTIIKNKKDAILNDNYEIATTLKIKEQELMSKINNLELKLAKINNIEVTLKDLEEVLINKIKIPEYIFSLKIDKKKIKHQLKSKIVGQDNKIDELINYYQQNIKNNGCYSMLFVGPTGVGKSMLAFEFANITNYHILKLNMNEYHEAHTISKLIGSTAGLVGYNEPAILDIINEYPFTILILDEIEKSHESIINLFLSAIDNNVIKNNKGDNIYFNNVIMILTSNISTTSLVGFSNEKNKNNYLNYFSKTFINRISKIIEFNKLTEENISKIINNMSKNNIKLTKKDKQYILRKCDYKNYGARQIPYVIKEFEGSIVKI